MTLTGTRTAARGGVRVVLGATAVLLVTALAGCTSPGISWQWGSEEAKAGEAEWKPCPEVAAEIAGGAAPQNVTYDCATVKVPRDWGNPDDGETLDVSLLRAHSDFQRDDERIGSLVVNPGGPGGSGVDTAVYMSRSTPIEVLRRFDIVGFDPRGVERSSPVECYSDADKDKVYASEPDPVSKAEFDELAEFSRDMVADCERKYGDTLKYFSTEQTARDMEAVRKAVGDDKLTYLGYSYGTLIGAVYAHLFPDKIRAMVLDGAVDPRQDEVATSKSQAVGFERAFANFARWCKQTGRSNCPIGPDAEKSLKDLMAEARKSPATSSDGRKATAGWVFSSVIYTMYVKEWWPRLAQALAEAEQGKPNRMFEIVDTFNERDSSGDYPNSMEILTTVNCVDEKEALSVEKVRELQGEWRKEHPLFGAPLALSTMTCAVWPDQHDPFPYGEAKGAPPIMVVGTTGDPATPYEQSGKLADLLGSGVLVTYRGEGHTAYPKPGCLNDTVNAYLTDLKVPDSEVTC
ncbi:MAG: alpha/beta hydrolase [Micromonosporaceae bacterium]